ncbi:unnamed protein product [Thlaspi arvense]|uniref:Uncharacterized protein n=1 Tax=Thlaspi arvense TaxID=13288 RepID=A0AAU9RSV7_THLAR|nr:unnamed protein product [Thlaspi arvense]
MEWAVEVFSSKMNGETCICFAALRVREDGGMNLATNDTWADNLKIFKEIVAFKTHKEVYNFHIFPRDELKIGMPSYSFSCQSSYLTSMAGEGFDFNGCIHDGKAYHTYPELKNQLQENELGTLCQTSSPLSVADTVFIERTKSRVRNWRNVFNDTSTTKEDVLIKSLRKLVVGSEQYGSRPSLDIDVCSELQVQLILGMLRESFDDLVPLSIPAKSGGTQAVRIVLTSSREDRESFERELQNLEEAHNKRVHGFREVIDLISTSQKPVVAHNSLNDFTFIYSKFISPLPSSVDEFRCSLHLNFPHILDISLLMKEIGPFKKMANLPAAIAFLKRRFFAPVNLEIGHQADVNEGTMHGHNVLKITELFAKLCSILKVPPKTLEDDNGHFLSDLENRSNVFLPSSLGSQDPINGHVSIWTHNSRKVERKDLVFLWGFRHGMSAVMLKKLLCDSHNVFSEEFDVRLLDKSCAVIAFWNPGSAERFLEEMESGGSSCESLREMIAEGARAAGYMTYRRACRLGLWEANLADSLDKASIDADNLPSEEPSEIPVLI